MKKTLVALAVAAIATSASAATVYNNDGTQVDVGGRFDVMLGKFNKGERADLRNNESRIYIQAQHDLGEGYKAVAYTRLRFNDGGDRWDTQTSFNNIKTNKLWLALEKDSVGRVSFGKQDTTGDAVQINDHSYIFGGNNNIFDGGDKVVSFRTADFQLAEGQTLGFGADYTFGESKKKVAVSANTQYEPSLKYAYGASAFYTGKFADLGVKLNAGYTVQLDDDNDPNTSTTGRKIQAWRLASQFTYGPATFGAEYGQSRYKDHQTQDKQGFGRFLEVAGKYQFLENASVYTAWERNEYKGSKAGLSFDKGDANFLRTVSGSLSVDQGQKLTENVYILGTDYAFNKNVTVYAEYAHSRIKGKGTIDGDDVTKSNGVNRAKDNRYGVGLRVYF